LVVFVATLAFEPGKRYSAKYDENAHKWRVSEGNGGVAEAVWEETRHHTGWDTFRGWTNKGATDEHQAFGLGYLEGALLQKLIYDAYRTNMNGTTTFPKKVNDWMTENDKWTRTQVTLNPRNPYWVQVGLVIQQSDGIFHGYNEFAPFRHRISKLQWLGYQYGPEVGDIFSAVSEQLPRGAMLNTKRPQNGDSDPYFPTSHCSALIKLSADGKNLFTSHDTWSMFTNMLRTYKFIETSFSVDGNVPKMQYSGYPGAIPSGDDYYMTSEKLVILETTNDILNSTLYSKVVPHNVMYWIRVTVAGRMAKSGDDWTRIFAMHNSGTYNNQWMVVDYKLFTPGQALKPGTLWIAEQIPGLVERADKTSTVTQTGYWASYNIPYFVNIYNMSGYPPYEQKYGDMWSYSNCARAKIFRRDQHTVQNMDTMKHIMRYNDYQVDPLSLKDACRGISARCDLNPPWAVNTMNPWGPFGAIDSKITDNNLVHKMNTLAVSGPTWDDQPPFAWTEQWKYYPHFSQPKLFAFDFVTMEH